MATNQRKYSHLRTVGTVALVALGAAGVIASANLLSRDRIIENQRTRQLAALQSVLGDSYKTAQLIAIEVDTVVSASSQPTPTNTFQMFLNDRLIATVFAVTAPDGYNGPIRLLVGLTTDGEITGVRVVNHRETPGLGDLIEYRKSNWLDQFVGTRLGRPDHWSVDRDGGPFDSLTGATVTPRAVVTAIENTLHYYEKIVGRPNE